MIASTTFWDIQAIFHSLLMSCKALLPSNQKQMYNSHLHFESPCSVCVYTSFTFGFYQSYAAIFAGSAFFYYGAILGSSQVARASRKPQWGFFRCFCGIHICSVGALYLWYIWFCHTVFFTYLHFSGFIFVFSRTLLLQCVLGYSSLITYQLLF